MKKNQFWYQNVDHSNAIGIEGAGLRDRLTSKSKSFLIKFTFKQLVNSYVHLGSIKSYTNPNMKYYLLGNYFNISIINLNYTISFFKLTLSLIRNNLLKNSKLLVIDESINLKTNIQLKESLDLIQDRNVYFVFRKWINGLITNKKNMKNSENIFLPGIPKIFFILFTRDSLSKYIFQEIKYLDVLTIKVLDGFQNPRKYFYWIPGNNKSPYSRRFYLYILLILSKKINLLKQKKFFKKLFKKKKEEEDRKINEKKIKKKRLNTI